MKIIRNCDYCKNIGLHDFFLHLCENDKTLQTEKQKGKEYLSLKFYEGWKWVKVSIEYGFS